MSDSQTEGGLTIRVHFREQITEGKLARQNVLSALDEMSSPSLDVLSVSGPEGTNDTIIVVASEDRKVTHTQLTELRKLVEIESFSPDEPFMGVADLEVVGDA